MTATKYKVRLRRLEEKQHAASHNGKKRTIWRAGRRGGKTTTACNKAVESFLDGWRVLYAVPTGDQLTRFWFEVKQALAELIADKQVYTNESLHIIEFAGTENRLRAKTAWNADTLRGDYADLLILDEFQLMAEECWGVVGAPMLLDNHGDAVFIYTPPSLHSRSVSKALDKRHAAKMWKARLNDPRWSLHHWTSHDNSKLSKQGLEEITEDMTALAFRQEILAEDVDEVPGALWKMHGPPGKWGIEDTRVREVPELIRVVVGVDPPGGATECGIVCAGLAENGHVYVMEDRSIMASVDTWATEVLTCYLHNDADRVLGEQNYGGNMVEATIVHAAREQGVDVSYKHVQATRGKAVRAEPVAAGYERGEIHHVGEFPELEEEMTSWVPGSSSHSPNRMDALVWAVTELKPLGRANLRFIP